MEYQSTINGGDNIYSHFIEEELVNITIKSNHTCNTEKELKFIFLKLFLNDFKQEIDDTDEIVKYYMSFEKKLNQETFNTFLKTPLLEFGDINPKEIVCKVYQTNLSVLQSVT